MFKLWSKRTMESMRKLKVCHNDILRRLLGVSRWSSATSLFVHECLDSFDVIMRKQSLNLRNQLAISKNPKIIHVYDSRHFLTSKLCNKWKDSLEIIR